MSLTKNNRPPYRLVEDAEEAFSHAVTNGQGETDSYLLQSIAASLLAIAKMMASQRR